MKTRSTFLFLLAISLSIGACTAGSAEPATSTPAAPLGTPTSAPFPTTAGPNPTLPADAVVHTLVEGNFSLALPAGWNVAGPFDTVQYRIYTFGAEAGQSGGPGVSQIVLANEGAVTIEQFAQLQCSVCALNPIEEATLGGLPAKRTTIGGDSAPGFEWYFINHAGKLIGFSIRPVGGGLEWVLPSLQFITPLAGQAQTYRNQVVGLEMQVPAGWQIQETTPAPAPVMLDTLAYIYSHPLPTPEPKGGEGPVEGVKIDVTAVYDPSINQSLEQALAWLKSGLGESNSQIISEERVVLAGGLQAVRLHTSSTFGEGVTLLTKVNEVVVVLGGSGTDLSLFDGAANTLHAVQPLQGALLNGPCTVTYANGNELFCLDASNLPVRVAQSEPGTLISSPKVSSDGKWVAYLITNAGSINSQLWAVSLDGTRGLEPLVLLAGQAELPNADPQLANSPNSFQWQAGTNRLFFDTRFARIDGEVGLGEYTHNDLWVVDVKDLQISNILGAGAGGPFYLAPDGQRLAISTPTSVKLLTINENLLQTVLEFPSIITYSEYQHKPQINWSADSTFFTMLVPSADPLAADTSGTLYRVNASGTVRTLWTQAGNFVFGGPLLAGISPDGQRMVSDHNDGTNTINLRLINTDGTNATVFATTSLAVNGWGWSSDSQTYAYGIVPEGGNFVLQANGVLTPFGEGITIVALEWASPNRFYFLGVTGNAQYALYTHQLGQSTQLVAGGLSVGVMLDVR